MTDEQLGLFLDYLRRQERPLYDEIEAELAAEAGTIDIDPHLQSEASMLVHRQLGNAKRFSEGDKKMITDMIALKSQTVANIWKARLQRLNEDFDTLKSHEERRTQVAQNSLRNIDFFLANSDLKMIDPMPDEVSTSESLLQNTPGGRDAVLRLSEKVERLALKFKRVLLDHSILVSEKELCLKIIGNKSSNKALNRQVEEYKYQRDGEKDVFERQIAKLRLEIMQLLSEKRKRETLAAIARKEITEQILPGNLNEQPIDTLHVDAGAVKKSDKGPKGDKSQRVEEHVTERGLLRPLALRGSRRGRGKAKVGAK